MKKTSFFSILAHAGLTLAAVLLISLASCNKERRKQPHGDFTMATDTKVNEEIELWFDKGDTPAAEGAEETDSKAEGGWLKKKYKLKAQKLIIKGKITRLWCYGNQLTSLNVSKFPELTYLNCSGNRLTSLDVRSNVELAYLDCQNNELKTLDLSKNTKLAYLNCYRISAEALNVTNNKELEKLICSNNALTSLDISVNKKLRELECYSNKLESLNLSENTKLATLYCSHNSLAFLDVSNNTELETIGCSNNSLTSLDVSNSAILKELSCYNNYLNGESIKLPDLTKEGKLYFKDEDSEDAQMLTQEEITIIENKNWAVKTYNNNDWHKYEGEERVITMTTSWAAGSRIELKFAVSDEPLVEGATEITSDKDGEWLQKAYTLNEQNLVIKGKVTKFLCDKKSLTSLDVSKNTKLTFLWCADNLLNTLNVSYNKTLEYIYCFGNRLTSLDIRNNTELIMLYCDRNSLTSLDASKNTKIKKLSCTKNNLIFENMKLPDLSGEKDQSELFFKDTDKGDPQKLTKDQVNQIKNKNWRVIHYKGNFPENYPGE